MEIDFNKYPLPNRMRHHTSPNLYIPLSELNEKPDYYPPLIESIDWSDVFGNGKPPAMLDVGCGKGKLLLDISESSKDKNILGIELRKQACDWLRSVIQGEAISNCGILWYSVVNGLHFIQDNTVEKIFYLFPDPWPKKKHHKRRAFNQIVISEFYRVLQPGGLMYLASDVIEVHEHHLQMLDNFGKFDYRIISIDDEWGLPVTNKETFCRMKNIHFDRIIARK